MYLTDCSAIREKGFKTIREKGGIIDHAIIDGLREEEHATHFNYYSALETGLKINAKHIYLTHITHQHTNTEISQLLDAKLEELGIKEQFYLENRTALPGYDGLKLKI